VVVYGEEGDNRGYIVYPDGSWGYGWEVLHYSIKVFRRPTTRLEAQRNGSGSYHDAEVIEQSLPLPCVRMCHAGSITSWIPARRARGESSRARRRFSFPRDLSRTVEDPAPRLERRLNDANHGARDHERPIAIMKTPTAPAKK
jgi:hypothetical protein